jgi:hypothetical protein
MGEKRNSQRINLTGAKRFSIGDITNVASPREDRGREHDEPGAEVGSPHEDCAGEPGNPVCRVLLLGANPSGTSRLRLDRESRAIDDALRTAPGNRRFELLQGWASSALDIQQDLFRHRPDLVHLSSHGDTAGELMLEAHRFRDLARKGAGSQEGATRQGALAPVDALARLLAHAPGGTRCVVLNACHSAPLAEAIAEHADCAIGMTTEISDSGAVAFAWSFYHALAQGESVATAFELACAQLDLRGSSPPQRPRLIALRSDPGSIRWGD